MPDSVRHVIEHALGDYYKDSDRDMPKLLMDMFEDEIRSRMLREIDDEWKQSRS